TRQICEVDGDGPRILILTTFDLDEYVYDALRAGASGFLLKDEPAERLFEAVWVIAAREALVAPAITRRAIAEFARPRPPPGGGPRRARRADATRDRDPRPRRGGPLESRDRAPARRQRRDGQDTRQPRPPQARAARSGAGGRRGVRVRSCHPRRLICGSDLQTTKAPADTGSLIVLRSDCHNPDTEAPPQRHRGGS